MSIDNPEKTGTAAAVVPVPGDGLLVRVGAGSGSGDAVALIGNAGNPDVVGGLVGLLREAAADPSTSGKRLARRLAGLLSDDPPNVPAFAVVAPADSGIVVFVHGDAEVRCDGDAPISGRDTATWADRVVRTMPSLVTLALGDVQVPDSDDTGPFVFALDGGIVPAGAARVRPAAMAGSAPVASAPTGGSTGKMAKPVDSACPAAGSGGAVAASGGPGSLRKSAGPVAPAAQAPGSAPGGSDRPSPGGLHLVQPLASRLPPPAFEAAPAAEAAPPKPALQSVLIEPLAQEESRAPLPIAGQPPAAASPAVWDSPQGASAGSPGEGPAAGAAAGHGNHGHGHGDRPSHGGAGGAGAGGGRGGDAVAAAPADEAAAVPGVGSVLVPGVICKNGHFNDPRQLFCGLCGINMVQQTKNVVQGNRPPLGFLTLDDGSVFQLDHNYMLGRDPGHAEEVQSGRLRALPVNDPEGSVSRAHARIELKDWDVLVVDNNSSNGTFVAGPSDPGWTRLPPNVATMLAPGGYVQVGARRLRYNTYRDT